MRSYRTMMWVQVALGMLLWGPMARAVDLDGDDISDVYESIYGGHLNPGDDDDGDGYDNLSEYLLGGDATTPDLDGFPSITLVNSTPKASWPSVVGLRYALQSSPDGLVWTQVGNVQVGDGQTLEQLHTAALQSDEVIYFRVVGMEPLDGDADGLNAWEEYELVLDDADADFDGDKVLDGAEVGAFLDPKSSADTDGDGLPDDWKAFHFGSMFHSIVGDYDLDGVANQDEYALGTNPNMADTDGDGLGDRYGVGLEAHWKFDEGSGASVSDASPNGFDGTMVGTHAWTNGVFGGAMDLKKTSRVEFSSIDLDDVADAITISFWSKGATDIGISVVFWGWQANGTRVLNGHVPWSGYVYWDAGSDAGGTGFDRVVRAAHDSLYKNRWNHWAFTKDVQAGEMRVYCNGRLWLVGQGKIRDMSGIVDFRIGQTHLGSVPYDGLLDDFRIYSRVLDEDEMWGLYAQDADAGETANGLPRVWELNHGVSDPHGDEENGGAGDGYTNLEEFINDTDPMVVDPAPVLIGHWPLEEGVGTTSADLSATDNDATLQNGAGWTSGHASAQAADFGAAEDAYVSAPHHAAYELGTGPFTVGMWFRMDDGDPLSSTSHAYDLFFKGSHTNSWNDEFFQLVVLGGGYNGLAAHMRRAGGNGEYFWSTADMRSEINDGGWHHAAFRRTETGESFLYLDGEEVARHGGYGHPHAGPGSAPLWFGRSPSDVSLDGRVDDVYFYSGALTPEEIAALADPDRDGDGLPNWWETAMGLDPDDAGATDPANGASGDPDGDGLDNAGELAAGTDPQSADTDGDGLDDSFQRDLAAHWRFDETSGTAADDASVHERDGTVVAGTWETGEGFAGGSLEFAATGDYTTLPPDTIDGATDLTVSLWMKTSNAQAIQAIFSAARAGNINEYVIALADDYFSLDQGSGGAVTWAGVASELWDGEWHHVVSVRDAANSKHTIYVDGVSKGDRTIAASALAVDPGGLLLGQGQDSVGGGFEASERYVGLLDEMRVYRRAVTAGEVATIYAQDTDGDGISNAAELAGSTDPEVADTDGDGLLDGEEVALGTDPTVTDSDLDGLNDGWEVAHALDALDDGTTDVTNGAAGNPDGDGLDNAAELAAGTDPQLTDTDGDGLDDSFQRDLAAHWRFDETSGTAADDASVHERDGTVVAGTWETGEGFAGGSLEFAATGDYTTLPPDTIDGATDLTVSFWMKTSHAFQIQAIFSAARAANINEYVIALANDYFSLDQGSGGAVTWSGVASELWDGEWHHVVSVRDAANSKHTIYVDGVSKGDRTIAASALAVDPGGLLLGQEQDSVGGGFQASQRYVGLLDEMRVYRRTVTAGEVATIYAQDTDGDGLTNAEELVLGTSPDLFDTDGDGEGDYLENEIDTDPIVAPASSYAPKPNTGLIIFTPGAEPASSAP